MTTSSTSDFTQKFARIRATFAQAGREVPPLECVVPESMVQAIATLVESPSDILELSDMKDMLTVTSEDLLSDPWRSADPLSPKAQAYAYELAKAADTFRDARWYGRPAPRVQDGELHLLVQALAQGALHLRPVAPELGEVVGSAAQLLCKARSVPPSREAALAKTGYTTAELALRALAVVTADIATRLGASGTAEAALAAVQRIDLGVEYTLALKTQ